MDNKRVHINKERMIAHPDENTKAHYADWLRGIAHKPDREVMEHVANCEQCKAEILEVADIMDELEQIENARKRQTRLIIFRSAAALVAVIMVALIIQFLKP
ncbi:MAG: hypothetical protein J7L96_06040, partial [Bacteroidales bacterium]|nr:hypothetical protein [Bacteroidales bacterium]